MKKLKWKMAILVCALVLSGCSNNIDNHGKKDNIENSGITAEISKDNTQDKDTDNNERKTNENEEEPVSQMMQGEILPPQMKELPMYTVDGSTYEVKATVQMIPVDNEVTAELIVQLVIDDLADNSYTLGLEGVKEENGLIIVNFSEDLPPVNGVNKETEVATLDAIAQSLIDNLPECKGVIYQVNGKEYISDNFIFADDYIYLGR